MRQILWVISLFTFVALVAVFSMLNHQMVMVHLLVGRQEASLITALAAAFGVGAFVAVLLLGYPLLRLNMRHRAALSKNRQLEKRLHLLQEAESRDPG